MKRAKGTITMDHHTSLRELLTPTQQQAIFLLVQGKGDRDIAHEVGVSRECVNRWRNHHPAFQACLHQERRVLWEDTYQQLRWLARKAVDLVGERLLSGDATMALQVLKLLELRLPSPAGEEDPERILFAEADAWAVSQMRQEVHMPSPLELLADPHAGRRAELTQARLAYLRESWRVLPDDDVGEAGGESPETI